VAAADGGEQGDDSSAALHPAIRHLSQLLGGGGGQRVQIVDADDGDDDANPLIQMLKRTSEALAAQHGKKTQRTAKARRAPPPSLPPIPAGTPITGVLHAVRESLARAAPTERERAREREAARGEHDADDADDADYAAAGGAYIAHLDERGLDLLEADLRAQLAQVAAARARLATSRRPPARAKPNPEPEAAETDEAAGDADDTRRVSSLEAALQRMLNGGGAAGSRLLGGVSSGESADGVGEADETESYASRLADEARRRERRLRGEEEEEAELEEGGGASSVEELVARMLGRPMGEGEAVEMKVFVSGPDGRPREVQVHGDGPRSLVELLSGGGDKAEGTDDDDDASG
jgi:hypothetical protein